MFNDNKCGKVLTAIGVSSMLLLSSTVYAASPLLRVGSRGNEVRQLQQSLKEVNVYNYKVTGYYGNITRDAVMKFQRQNGLAVDGIVGKKTLAALNGTYNTKSTQVSKNSRLLRRGSRGADVKDLQQKLKSKGYHKYSVDGIFGFRTEQSVKNFQKANGLVADGIVGQRTLAALQKGSNNTNRSTSTSNSSRLLRRGSRGADVKDLQQKLKSKGYHKYSVDGIFGFRTEQSVKNFQKANGLVADGIVGSATMAKLKLSSTDSSSSRGSSNKSSVEMLHWSTVRSLFPRGATAVVTDVDTGKSFKVYRMGGTNHADVEPLTANDTAIMKSIYGNWSWARRAIIVDYGGRRIAASMNGMPHGQQTIYNNNFNGQFCIHFLGSKTHGSGRVDPDHQAMVRKAAR